MEEDPPMRVRQTNQGLTVQAISGTHVALLGFDLPEEECDGLLGFAIHRTDHIEEEAYWLKGLKSFAETDPGLPPGAQYSTRSHPIQGFSWSDFSAKPGYDYTYRVVALKGTPRRLRPAFETTVRVQTEAPEGGIHDIAFNRGAAASQEYARRFGNRRPDDVGKAAFEWLSRGLFECMLQFIAQADGPEYALRICAYEFHYEPVLAALRAARDRGVDVRIIYDRREENPGERNDQAVAQAGLADLCTLRRTNPSAISHNKFIVRLRAGAPEAVLTGGTNFSQGGIFGHSNVVHIVESSEVAASYLRYWQLLAADPRSAALRPQVEALYELPTPGARPPIGTGAIFSPRSGLAALEWYTSLAAGANDALFATFAFGMHPLLREAYRSGRPNLRYALMEKLIRPMEEGPQREAEEAEMLALRRQPENRFAVGAHLRLNRFDSWMGEQISGLNRNVQYVHTKYMLLDPLGPDPLLVAGSANFSAASTNENDENMLVIRGDRRAAEIYLSEFMRLYNHYAFREWAASPRAFRTGLAHLRTDAWWRDYFGDTPRSRQRAYFAGEA